MSLNLNFKLTNGDLKLKIVMILLNSKCRNSRDLFYVLL